MSVLTNYGDFTDGSPSTPAIPSLQFVSTTNPAAAHADFVATRLNGNDTSGSQHNSSPSGSGSSGDSSKSKSFFDKYKIPLIAGAVVVALGVFATIVSLMTRRRRKVYRPLFEETL